MTFARKGLIFNPNGTPDWAQHSFMTPTPFLLDESTIRLFGACRDSEGMGRIAYIDVDASDPSRVLTPDPALVLDIGTPGMFDDNGMILGDVLRVGDRVYMYYVGFQLVKRAKFLAYSGLAISDDGGTTFSRFRPTPILDRHPEGLFIRAIHSVHYEDGLFRIWYSVGNGWERINGMDYPQYDIRYCESEDGIHFSGVSESCIQVKHPEYRIGRPRVYRTESGYEMYYTFDTLDKRYTTGYAVSSDGVHWDRCDEKCVVTPTGSGWESDTAVYPARLDVSDRSYLFYNGNDMGRTGVGYGEFVE